MRSTARWPLLRGGLGGCATRTPLAELPCGWFTADRMPARYTSASFRPYCNACNVSITTGRKGNRGFHLRIHLPLPEASRQHSRRDVISEHRPMRRCVTCSTRKSGLGSSRRAAIGDRPKSPSPDTGPSTGGRPPRPGPACGIGTSGGIIFTPGQRLRRPGTCRVPSAGTHPRPPDGRRRPRGTGVVIAAAIAAPLSRGRASAVRGSTPARRPSPDIPHPPPTPPRPGEPRARASSRPGPRRRRPTPGSASPVPGSRRPHRTAPGQSTPGRPASAG